MTLVSTIIPTYNAGAFIREAINSALAQTHRKQEVIVVDDGSTDGTLDLLQEYGDRIHVIQQQNGGPAAARNAGARVATGEWLAFLDADDVWVPEKLERQLQAADGCDVVYSDRLNFGAVDRVATRRSDNCPLPSGHVFEQLLGGNFVTFSSVLIRTKVFRKLSGFDEDPELKAVEDWEFLLRCAVAGHYFGVCPDVLVHYRWHKDGISRDHDRLRRRRLAVVYGALKTPQGQRLSPQIHRSALASAWRTSAWCVAEASRLKAALWYARSLIFEPLSYWTYKQIAKACLGRD